MEFERIPIILKRFDFVAKMNICQNHSIDIMSTNGLISMNELKNKALPWELETFALFSVLSLNEYSNQNFESNKGKKLFSEIITSIRNYEHPKLKSAKDNNQFTDYFIIVTGLTQFQIQENFYYKIYRYLYILNFKNEKVDMKKQFINKFDCTYEEFLELGLIINFLFANKIMDPKIFKYVIEKYQYVIRHLLKEREVYIRTQEKITQNIEQYLYGFKFFYQFPFIQYDKNIFLPLPHLVMQSVTSSILFRITEGNDSLRQLFGKEVLENYILHICGLSKMFDEIVEEYEYKLKGNDRTLDVMIKKGNLCFMLDSKSMAPKISLRDLTETEMQYTIDRIVKSVVQVYRHITERFQEKYYPFTNKIEFLHENIFGAVILFEDSFIRRELIMRKAAEVLRIDLGSEKYTYLCSNVMLISLHQLESMIFENEDIFQSLISRRKDASKWFDYNLSSDSKKENYLVPEINQVTQNAKDVLSDFIRELKHKGLIQ